MTTETISNTEIAPNVFLLRVRNPGFSFIPGQHVFFGIANHEREYSICSPPSDTDGLEILYRVIPEGYLTPKLKELRQNDTVAIRGPFGDFSLQETVGPVRMFATGTGIAPFRSMMLEYPGLDYRLYHGSSTLASSYASHFFPKERLVRCVSRESTGDFPGRVTAYAEKTEISLGSDHLLCGNSDMVYEMFHILTKRGLSREKIHAEIYF